MNEYPTRLARHALGKLSMMLETHQQRDEETRLDDPLQTSFSLAAGQWWEGNNWTDSWNRLNKTDEFDVQARDLSSTITAFRSLLTP